jgi:hypothetical protein
MESRPKMIIMGLSVKGEMSERGQWERKGRKERVLGDEEDQRMLYVCIYIHICICMKVA